MCNQHNYSSRDTEYYDYGHGEAQETYEAYGMSGNPVLFVGKGLHVAGSCLHVAAVCGSCSGSAVPQCCSTL